MPIFTATRLQVVTYLLGVCPFSIAFLVFLNSSVSFVITDLIGKSDGVGNAVGNLGFADELVALVACPFWGLLSDRIGVRSVCVTGYAIICLALVLFVQTKNVYPQLLLARLFFSIGGAAASTMVTAVLPTMSYKATPDGNIANSEAIRHAQAPSITSELTITPARFQSSASHRNATSQSEVLASARTASTSHIAGMVGMFTGLGALLALFVFLPLPAVFQKNHIDPRRALQYSYYIVAAVALLLSATCLIGLRNLVSESKKGWLKNHRTINGNTFKARVVARTKGTADMLKRALLAGFQRPDIGIGYLGGFVARASSVGISLFIPLLVNSLFDSSGLCDEVHTFDNPAGLPDIKRKCPKAYLVAAAMTGVSQMVALLAAPLFGYWSARTSRKGVPLATAAAAGIIGYPLFCTRFDPDGNNKGARAIAFVAVCLVGFSQIGAIVCSLASLSAGILMDGGTDTVAPTHVDTQDHAAAEDSEHETLLQKSTSTNRLADIKGSVAGVYSFFGGVAILILTKAGGALFDSTSIGAPFYIMAGFNAILLLASIAVEVI